MRRLWWRPGIRTTEQSAEVVRRIISGSMPADTRYIQFDDFQLSDVARPYLKDEAQEQIMAEYNRFEQTAPWFYFIRCRHDNWPRIRHLLEGFGFRQLDVY